MERSIRIGKDFNVRWSIKKVVDGERQPYVLAGKELVLQYRTPYGLKEATEWEVVGNTIVWTFRGKEQKALGSYELILTENGGKDGMLTVDTRRAFKLVAHSCEETEGSGCDIVIEDVVLESEVAFAPVVAQGSGSYDDTEIKKGLAELSARIEVQFVNENKGITGAGTIVNSTGEKCTNIVAVKGAKSVVVTSLYSGANVFFYDQTKTLISSSSGAKQATKIDVPEEAYYVAVTDLMRNASSLLAYSLTEVQAWMNDRLNKVQTPLIGKVLSVNGDSICQGQGYRGGYAKIIGERNAMVVENLGDGGAVIALGRSFSDGTPRHCIANTITSMREDADYILIEGGANDAGLGIPVGKISDGYNATLDTSTYCGAFEYMLQTLISRFAGKKYGYIAVHQCVAKYRVTDTDKTTSYYWLSKAMCEKWGVPFCDLNSTVPPFNYLSNSEISEVNSMYTNNGDGWHPNEAGYKKYYCDKIEAFMLSL